LNNKKGLIRALKSLANEKRFDIYMYCDSEKSVLEITKHLKISQALASSHIKEMKLSGLLKSRQDGQRMFYVQNEKSKQTIKNNLTFLFA
jgi:predicted transcriptional regulator